MIAGRVHDVLKALPTSVAENSSGQIINSSIRAFSFMSMTIALLSIQCRGLNNQNKLEPHLHMRMGQVFVILKGPVAKRWQPA